MYSTVIIHGWEKEAIDSRGSRCSIPPHLLLYVYIVSLPFLILIASCTRQLKALWSSSLSLFLILFLILFPPFLCVIQSNLSASSGKLVSKRKCVLTFISSRRKKKKEGCCCCCWGAGVWNMTNGKEETKIIIFQWGRDVPFVCVTVVGECRIIVVVDVVVVVSVFIKNDWNV